MTSLKTAKALSICFAIGLPLVLTEAAKAAEADTEQAIVAKTELLLGDENSDAMHTGTIAKVDSGSCEMGTADLKVPGQKKAHIPEEQP